jgi:type I restriction enzyme S subunit
MSEWKEYKLGEIAEIIPGFAFKSKEFGKIGELVIKIKDINPPYIILSAMERVDTSSYPKDKLGKYKLAKGDFVVAMTGATIGKVGKLKTDVLAYINQRVAKIKAKNCVCNDFIYYSISTEQFQAFIRNNIDSNTAQENISAISIGKFPILLPPLPEQKAIASILSSLDDKIDLLHRQNATLEKMAETLFRQRFIEEAKEEWKEGRVSDYALHLKDSIQPQKNPSTFYFHYSISSFDNGRIPITELGEEVKSNKYKVPKNCILFSKLNPHKEKRVWLLQDEVEENSICSTEFQVVFPKNKQHLYFLYGWLTFNENYNEIASGVGGTSSSHQRIDPKAIYEFQCPLISDSVIENFNVKIKPIFMKQVINQNQIRTLTALRDTLLPKLMSGEIRVNQT